MLSPLDDYPVHQISEPMRHVGTSDRNFYDRYYFNIHGAGEVHGTDDELFAVIGVGQYPNLSVADAFVSVLWGDDHRVVRSSDAGRRSHGRLGGAIRVEVVKGLEEVRVIVEPNQWGIELDAVYRGFSEAHLESRHFDRQFSRVTFDSTRFAQVGSWDGTLGSADASSASLPTVGGVPGTARGAFDRWVSPNLRASGRPTPREVSSGSTRRSVSRTTPWSPSSRSAVGRKDHAGRPPGVPLGSGREAEWLGRPEHELRFAPGTRRVTGATLTYYGAHGGSPPRSRWRPCWPSRCCWGAATGSSPIGGTACTRATWWCRDRRSRRPTRPTRPGASPSTPPGSPTTGRSATACSSAPSWDPTASTGSPAGREADRPATGPYGVRLPEGPQRGDLAGGGPTVNVDAVDLDDRPAPRSMRMMPTLAASSPHRNDWLMVKRMDWLAPITLS